jgi:hypothetical protein
VVVPGIAGLVMTALLVVGTLLHVSQPATLDEMAPQQYYADMPQQPQLASAADLQQQLRQFNQANTQQLPIMQTTTTTTSPMGAPCGCVALPSCPCAGAVLAPSAAPWYYPQRSKALQGLMPGASQYYSPSITADDGLTADTANKMQTLLQKMTRELSTDTMEIANLQNQIAIDNANPDAIQGGSEPERLADRATLNTLAEQIRLCHLCGEAQAG